MHNVGFLQEKIDKARQTIADKSPEFMDYMNEVRIAYAKGFPDQEFHTYEEVSIAASMLCLFVEFHLAENDLGKALPPFISLSKMLEYVLATSPFTELQKKKLSKMKIECWQKIVSLQKKDESFIPDRDYEKVERLSEDVLNATASRNKDKMLASLEALNTAGETVFGGKLKDLPCIKSYFIMKHAILKCLSFNNFGELCRKIYAGVKDCYNSLMTSSNAGLSELDKDEIKKIMSAIESDSLAYMNPLKRNRFVLRWDYRCTLCRQHIADETGSHMVPNFLARNAFSYDGSNKNDREALDFQSLNAPEANRSYYGREVPVQRIEMAEGHNFTEEDIKNNVNLLMYDNEFCKSCEKRFGVLETAYSDFYNGNKKTISPRLAYLFWLSVLWRMSMGRMGVFIKIEVELELRDILDKGISGMAKEIANSTTDLGQWYYVAYQCKELREGDKGILGSRYEYSPYVIIVNDMVVVFFPSKPEKILKIGSLSIYSSDLQSWHKDVTPHKQITRKTFWSIRDYIIDSAYENFSPSRENRLLNIREYERHIGKALDTETKGLLMEVLSSDEEPLYYCRIPKFSRVLAALMRQKEADEKHEDYDPLKDEELFLNQKDFDNFDESISEIDNLEEKQEPYVNPYRKIGRNDPCPCGSGKKYKRCCGRNE